MIRFVELYYNEYDLNRLIYNLHSIDPYHFYRFGKADTTLHGVKRYVNLIYRIYNGNRRKGALPMKF